MNEPDNRTAWVDRFGDAWVRVDNPAADRAERWYLLTDGVGTARPWGKVEECGPFTPADPVWAAQALTRVERKVAR